MIAPRAADGDEVGSRSVEQIEAMDSGRDVMTPDRTRPGDRHCRGHTQDVLTSPSLCSEPDEPGVGVHTSAERHQDTLPDESLDPVLGQTGCRKLSRRDHPR
jgi:hypothetical protein